MLSQKIQYNMSLCLAEKGLLSLDRTYVFHCSSRQSGSEKRAGLQEFPPFSVWSSS